MARATWDWEGRIGRRVRLRDLHILSAVARCGTMAKAASHLGMSQPAVSEAIANLERALQVHLMDRTPQGVEPTVYAEALLKRGHVVFDELRQGIKDIEFLSDPTVGEVRIGCPEFLSVWFMPTVIDRFSRQYPRVTIRIVQPDISSLEFRELHERSADLMLARLPGSFSDNDLTSEMLFDDPRFVVTASHNPWARRRTVSLADLRNEPWIVPPLAMGVEAIERSFEAEGLAPPPVQIVAASVHLRVQLLATGRFIATMANSVLRGVANQLSYKVLPVELHVKSLPIAVVRLKRRMLSPVAGLFLEHLREAVKSM